MAVTAAVVDVPWPPLSDHIEINMSSLLPRRSAGADSQRSQNCRSRHRSLAVASPDAPAITLRPVAAAAIRRKKIDMMPGGWLALPVRERQQISLP